MGCDIHIVLEEKIADQWVGIHASGTACALRDSDDENSRLWFKATGRDYAFFAALAGVRGSGPEPLGLPEDASQLTLAMSDEWGGDGHSHSYCSLEEFCYKKFTSDDEEIADAMRKKLKGEELFFVGKLFGRIDDRKNYRVVFWFDN